MRFINQIKDVLQNEQVRDWVHFLLKEGEKDARFITFFGVNYNESSVVSLKLYFSFFDFFPQLALEKMQFPKETIHLIRQYWTPVEKLLYSHQYFTVSLKCFIVDNTIVINPYFGFRSEKIPYIAPKYLKLTQQDLKNPIGICFERSKGIMEQKNYYYLSNLETKKEVFLKFGEDQRLAEKTALIEYTESDMVQKMNITFCDGETTRNFLFKEPHHELDTMCNFFFTTKNWYHYAPGIRMNSDTKAVYFIPKETHYTLTSISLVEDLYQIFKIKLE